MLQTEKRERGNEFLVLKKSKNHNIAMVFFFDTNKSAFFYSTAEDLETEFLMTNEKVISQPY